MSAPFPAAEVAPSLPSRRVAVVCESTCCLPAALVERYRIGVIPIPFSFGDELFLDGVTITPGAFYARLARDATPPKTSPPSPGDYLDAWRRAAADAGSVVLVTVAGTVSTMQRSALLARDLAAGALPQTQIAVVDSRSAAMGQGFVALAAARAAAAGAPLEAVVAAAERVRDRTHMFVTLDTLEYLARASRIPQVAAFLGGLLAIKPVVRFAGGDIRMVARVRTRRRAVEALIDCVQRAVPDGARVHLAVHHAQAAEEAAALAARLRGLLPCEELYITEFTPVMGGYCGPGLLGVAFYADHDGD